MGVGAGLRNGRFTASDQPLRRVIAAAYGITIHRVFGPDWLDGERFDFLAKAPEGVPDIEMKPMLQSLLKDRFQLIAHTERREMSVYELVVAKGGVKMPVYPGPQPPVEKRYARICCTMGGAGLTPRLADMLSIAAGRPVVDKTGLTERYSYTLSYSSSGSDGDLPDNAPPDLFAAVQEQLGLKLQPGKASLDVVVVDHMEHSPSDN
jgi:uncharacterized protein (TIGR03435 family)